MQHHARIRTSGSPSATRLDHGRDHGRARGLVDSAPTLLMHRGQVLHEQLDATRLVEADLQAAMRAANVHRYADVDAIVLEKTGRLSVVHHSVPTQNVEPRLIGGVSGADDLTTVGS